MKPTKKEPPPAPPKKTPPKPPKEKEVKEDPFFKTEEYEVSRNCGVVCASPDMGVQFS